MKCKPEVVGELHEGGITNLQSFNKLQINMNADQNVSSRYRDENNENLQLLDIALM